MTMPNIDGTDINSAASLMVAKKTLDTATQQGEEMVGMIRSAAKAGEQIRQEATQGARVQPPTDGRLDVTA